MADIQDLASGSAYVNGDGALVWSAFAVTSCVRTALGTYDLVLVNTISSSEYTLHAEPVGQFGMDALCVAQIVSATLVRVRTRINGSAADLTFTLDIDRKRQGVSAIPALVPASAPSPNGLAANQTVFVGALGLDTNDGTAASPVLTLERAFELASMDSRRATIIQLGWDAATQSALGQTLTYAPEQTLLGANPFGGSASPLLLLGSFASQVGTRAVSASSDVDPGANVAVADVQDNTLVIGPSSTAGSLVAGAAAGQVRYSDPALIGALGTVAVGDMWIVGLAENPANNGSYGVAAVNNATGTLDLRNSQATLPNQIGPGTGDSITITTDAAGNRVVRIDDAAAAFTTAVTNKFIKLTGCTNPINNGYFPVTARNSASQIEISAPNAVAEVSAFTWNFTEANSGALYGQRSFEGCRLRWVSTSAALSNQGPRTIRDHGVNALGNVTFIAASAFVAGETWTVPDGTNAPVVWRFRKSGADGLGAVLATDIDFVDNTPTAPQCAAIAAARINTTLPSTLAVRAFASLGNAVLQLANMRLGSSGNTVMTETVANAGFVLANFGTGTEISAARPGFGTPTTTFRINHRWTTAPTVGDTFVVERPNTIIDVGGNSDAITEWDSGVWGMIGLRFVNVAATPGALFFGLGRNWTLMKGIEFDGRGGGSVSWTNGGVMDACDLFCADLFSNQVPNPFGVVNTSQGDGVFAHDLSNLSLGGGALGMFGFWVNRSAPVNVNGKQAFLTLNAPDFFRSPITCGSGHLFINASSVYFGRLREQLTLNAGQGLVNLSSNGGNASGNISQCELLGSGGDAIRADQGAAPLIATQIGYGHAGVGLRALAGSSMRVTASGLSVTGAGGDLKVGNRSARTYTSFGATAPIGGEVDPNDGSRIATTTPQNFAETRSGTILAGQQAVDIVFGAGFGAGVPVTASINTLDATAVSCRAVWQAGTTLRITSNAVATADTVVSATAQYAQS